MFSFLFLIIIAYTGTYYSKKDNRNYTNYTTSYQNWYNVRNTVDRPGGDPISGDIGYSDDNSTVITTEVYDHYHYIIHRRNITLPIQSTSITDDGNLTVELKEDVPYGSDVNIKYIKDASNFNNRYDRQISDVYHNAGKSKDKHFFSVIFFFFFNSNVLFLTHTSPRPCISVNSFFIECDNQINPMLQKATVVESLPHVLNLTFTGKLERSPQISHFNVSVDNVTIPIENVYLDLNGRLIIELYPNVVTIKRPWSASNKTIFDPMQPIDVSYYKAPLPPNVTSNTTIEKYRQRRQEIENIEKTHISDKYFRSVSSFYKLYVNNYVHDHTSPIYRMGFVYDDTPDILRIGKISPPPPVHLVHQYH